MSKTDTSLVVGASGLIGSYLFDNLKSRGQRVQGTYYSHPLPGLRPLDVADLQAAEQLLSEVSPSVVYFPAANPNVEWIEENPEAARAINVSAPQQFINLLRNRSTKFVYYSTEYVFDGVAGPYTEEDVPNPLSVYGQHKWEMEQFVQANVPNHLVLRVTVVYGWEARAKNFAHRLVNNLRAGNTSMRIPADQISSPSYAPNVAEASIELVEAGAVGVFHVCGSQMADRYEFARAVADTFGFSTNEITSVTTDQLVQRAARPLRAGMVVSKAQNLLRTPLLGYQEALKCMRDSEAEFKK